MNLKQLKSTGRQAFFEKEILKDIPTSKDTREITFFKIKKIVTDNELEKEYDSRNLIPAPVMTILTYDRTNKKEMDVMGYVGTHWKDAKGNWCYATFDRWDGRRYVGVVRVDGDWGDFWWFAGVRKSDSSQKLDSQSSSDTLSLELRVKNLESDMEKIKKFLII